MVTSHVRDRFSPINRCSSDSPDWYRIISKSVLTAITTLGHLKKALNCILISNVETLPYSIENIFINLPWRRNNWEPTVSQMELYRQHSAFKHLESSFFSQPMRKSLGDAPMTTNPQKVELHEMFSFCSSVCASSQNKVSALTLGNSKSCSPLEFISHKIQNKTIEILATIDRGNRLLKLKMLPNRTKLTKFNGFYS